MLNQLMKHSPIFLTIAFTVMGQCMIKWHMVNSAGEPPKEILDKLMFLALQLTNPWVILAMVFTLLSGLTWMLAMSKFDISYAYSFLGLNFVFTLILGVAVFNEPLVVTRVLGVLLIAIGVPLVASR